jgi:hypothetical protein
VLAVVHQLAGLAIGERGRTSSQLRPRIDEQDPNPALRQRRRGAEAGEAPADDDDGV